VLIAALLLAASAIFVRRNMRQVPPAQLVVGMTGCAAVLGLAVTLIFENPAQIRPSIAGILAWLTLGIFGAAIAWQLYFWLVANRGATFATLIMFLTPPVAVVLGAVFLGSAVTWSTVVGMLVILVSIAIMDGVLDRVFRSSGRAPSPSG
jgi:drug/metabolite transporter (DMT)-like permease